VSGNNLGAVYDGFVLVDPLRVRKIARQSGGVIWLIPDIELWNETTLVKTPTKEYNVDKFPELFRDIGSEVS